MSAEHADVPASLHVDPTLGVVPVEFSAPLRAGHSFDVMLVTHDPESLLAVARALHDTARLDEARNIHVALKDASTLNGDPAGQHSRVSWLVDFDQPVVQALAASVQAEHGDAPTLNALALAVTGQLTEPQHGGFDIASQAVAKERGDCSEHAVVLTALARHFGHSARVVMGFVVANAAPHQAFGHAWVEVHDGVRWHRHDSALLGVDTSLYLPLATLTDEGAGYGFALLQHAQLMLSVQRIVVTPTTPVTRAPHAPNQ